MARTLIDLSSSEQVQGTLPVVNGGTGNTTGNAWNVQSYFRVSRHSTTTVAVTSGSANLLASSFYDTTDNADANYTFTAASNNKIAVTAAGLYHVQMQVMSVVTAVTGALNMTNMVLYKGSGAGASSIFEHGATTFTYDQAGNRYTQGDFFLPLAAADYIQPGIYHVGSTTAMTVQGEATGAGAYMKMARIA